MINRVLITVNGDCPFIPEMRQMLREEGIDSKQADLSRLSEDELIEQAADCTSVIAGPERWTSYVFDHLKNFKCIVKSGVGLDAIELDAATQHGVVVANTPGKNADAVADMAAAMILSLLRKAIHYDAQVRAGRWGETIYCHEMSRLTIGLIGFGFIAKRLAKILSGFGCKFLAYDVFQDRVAARNLGVTFASFEDVLKNADIISLHIPLTEETRECINRKTINLMKPEAMIVNTCRGGVINEADLYAALKNHRIAAAALDVFTTEPPPADWPLYKLDNVQFSPHTATATYEAMENLYTACAKQSIQFYKGEKIDNTVNPDYVKYLR